MLKIKGNTISLTRGDSAWLSFPMEIQVPGAEAEAYVLAEGDTLQLTVRRFVDSPVVLQKSISQGDTFHILPEDTKELDFGSYVYDVQLTTAAGDVFTVIDTSVFIVATEVT